MCHSLEKSNAKPKPIPRFFRALGSLVSLTLSLALNGILLSSDWSFVCLFACLRQVAIVFSLHLTG